MKSVFGFPSSAILFGVAVCSFLFYGVVGQDKTWLLAPAFILTYAVITSAMLKRAWRMANGEASRREPATSNHQPVTALLWLTFLIYGIAVIPNATVPFEAKLVTLFVGAVIGAYLVWGGELTTFKDNRILLGVLIFVVMLTALYGLIVHFKCPDWVLWAERYTDAYIKEGRLVSTYICPNHFAHLMQMLMPFCVALLFIPQAGIYLKLLSAYSFLAFLPPLYLTESRAGWLGAIVATGVVLCLMALRRSRKLFAFLIILVPLCSVLLLLGAWQYSETFQRRMKPVVEFLQHQNEEGVGSEAKDFRPQTWWDTVDMIKESPLIGFGPGNYRYTFPEHRKRFRGTRIVTGHPHNEYLELITDYGLIGFGLFALAWCYGLVRILIASLKAEESRHAFIGFAFLGTAAGTMVHSFFDFEMHVYPNALVFAFLAALAWGPLAARRAKGSRKKAMSSRGESEPISSGAGLFAENPAKDDHRITIKLHQSAAWLLGVGYLLGAFFCIQVMSSAFIRALGDKRSEAADTRHLAIEDKHSPARMYSLAIRLDPKNGRAYKGMGNLLFGHRYYSLDMDEKVRLAERERIWYAKAYEHNSKDPEICKAYGKVLIFLGKNQGRRTDGRTSPVSSGGPEAEDTLQLTADSQISRGLDLLREACRYRPFNDVYWWNLGVELRKTSRYEEALDIFHRAASIKRTPSTKKNIEWLEDRLKTVESVDTAPNAGAAPLQPAIENIKGVESEEWTNLAPTNATADRGLMDLLDRMDE